MDENNAPVQDGAADGASEEPVVAAPGGDTGAPAEGGDASAPVAGDDSADTPAEGGDAAAPAEEAGDDAGSTAV